MKILHIISDVDLKSGGPIEGILRLRENNTDQYEIEVLCMDDPAAPHVAAFPAKVHAMGPRFGPKAKFNLLHHYGYAPRMVPWLREHARDYDAIIVNGLWNYAPFAASRVLPGGPVPYFVFTHGMMDPWFKQTYPLKHLFKQLFWWAGEGRLLKGATAVVFTAEDERILAKGVFHGHSGYTEFVSGYGTTEPPAATEAQTEAFRTTVPALGDRPYLLFLSRIHRKKGCDLLVEAFARSAHNNPDLQLVIAGPDQEGLTPALQARAEALGIAGRIHWPGMLKGDAKWGAFRGADAFVLPSHQENFGIVIAEAMACGTPVLTTRKVNIWREIDQSGGGLIADDTQDSINGLVARWTSLRPDEQLAMRAKARTGFETHFMMANAAKNLAGLIRNHVRDASAQQG